MTKMKIQFDPKALQAKLDANKERATKKREEIPIEKNYLLKVDKEGSYKFRATYYLHSEDPTTDPFPTRFYHFGIPGAGILYCPKKNEGKDCDLCEFVWGEMKLAKGTKDKVKAWADKLPKARLWVPGKLRGDREAEGCKFLTIGTYEDKWSENHKELYKWFTEEDTMNWLDPDVGFDIVLEYEAYDEARSKMFNNAKFGLKKGVFKLARKDSPFGKDFDTLVASMPNIDDSEDPSLKPYRKRTTEETKEALNKWLEFLNRGAQKASASLTTEELDTSSDSQTSEVESEATTEQKSLTEKLKKMGINV